MPPEKNILVNTIRLENVEITLFQIYNYKKRTYLDLIRCKAVRKLIKNEELIRNQYFIKLLIIKSNKFEKQKIKRNKKEKNYKKLNKKRK